MMEWPPCYSFFESQRVFRLYNRSEMIDQYASRLLKRMSHVRSFGGGGEVPKGG